MMKKIWILCFFALVACQAGPNPEVIPTPPPTVPDSGNNDPDSQPRSPDPVLEPPAPEPPDRLPNPDPVPESPVPPPLPLPQTPGSSTPSPTTPTPPPPSVPTPPAPQPTEVTVNRVYDTCPSFTQTLNIPIQVNDQNNTVEREPGITSFFVPFSRGTNLRSLNALVVRDQAGNRLPAQFETLSRWGSHPQDCNLPIRHAYAFVRAVPQTGSTVTWRVAHEPSVGGEQTPLSVEETETQWTITTGPARFTIRRDRFEGLSRVEVATGGGFQTVSEITGAAGSAGFLLERNGTQATSHQQPWSLSLERRGPQLVTLAAKGYYTTANNPRSSQGTEHLGYTIRLYFYAGSAAVKIDHTFYHGTSNGLQHGDNTTVVQRSWMRLPLVGDVNQVRLRAENNIQTIANPTSRVRLEQLKRIPRDMQLVGNQRLSTNGNGLAPFEEIRIGTNPSVGSLQTERVRYELEMNGTTNLMARAATRPLMVVQTNTGFYAMGTIAHLDVREPQGLRYDPASRSLDVDFTSSVIQVGGLRGIWSTAVVDFGLSQALNAETRGDQLQALAERQLLGTPEPAYINTTQTIGPYAKTTTTRFRRWFSLHEQIHNNTVENLNLVQITGLQIWPDLGFFSCRANNDCPAAPGEGRFYEGAGFNNYWNWAKPGFDEFFRTGRNEFVYDFSYPEAISYVETFDYRSYHDRSGRPGDPMDSNLVGGAPCKGGYRPFEDGSVIVYDPPIEGLNQRRDCVGGYHYSKHLELAYLATADRRFVDYWEQVGRVAVNRFGTPPQNQPELYDALIFSRFNDQILENVVNATEFSRNPQDAVLYHQRLRAYLDQMLQGNLINGHSCDSQFSGSTNYNSARSGNACESNQAWMMSTPVDFAIRSSRLLQHQGILDWLAQHITQITEHHTQAYATGPLTGLPDYSQRDTGPANSQNGWRTVYRCNFVGGNVNEASCRKLTDLESNGYFFENGMMAFLNLFGLSLDGLATPTNSNPNRICDWLPAAFEAELNNYAGTDANPEAAADRNVINGYVWGKASGQGLAFTANAVGALAEYCE